MYTVSSEPRTVAARRKYRDPYEQSQRRAGNMMWDPRVYRGSAFASKVIPPSVQEEMERKAKEEEIRRRRAERRQMMKMQQEAEERIGTPPPVDGRKHIDVQTEAFLEEILDRPVEVDVDTQTDPFLDRPPSPLFVPQKSGIDEGTQIYQGDLFDFDMEVEPLLEVLVGKTLEQSMMEVLQEEELDAMTQHQKEFTQIRNTELAETQRMEAAERRRWEEKERRKEQERERVARENKVMRKLAARGYATTALQNLQRQVFAELDKRGYFFDTVEREVEQLSIPSLFARAEQHLGRKRNAHAVVDALVAGSLSLMIKEGEQAREARLQKQKEEEERRRAAEEERQRKEAEKLAEIQRKKEEEERRKEEERLAQLAADREAAEDDEEEGKTDDEDGEEEEEEDED